MPTRTLDPYQSILYTFYNEDLVIKDDDIHSALADACSILDIAEYLNQGGQTAGHRELWRLLKALFEEQTEALQS